MNDDPILPDLLHRYPKLDPSKARGLAQVWSALLERIIVRMLRICEQEVGASLHIDHRPEAVFELAKLQFFVCRQIVDSKAASKTISEYDADSEAALLDTKEGRAKIENTARNLAEGVWKPFLAKWRKRRPLIELPGEHRRRVKLPKSTRPPFRKHMHYVPQSTTRQWACAKSGKFQVYSIALDGEVQVEASTARVWGAAPSLYTQRLERHLGLIEGDARRPYRKLIDVMPLNAMETRCWIAFLISQLIRTPRFMRGLMRRQKLWIEGTSFKYPTSPAHLGRAFETLFTNNDLYAFYHKQITSRAWTMVRAADGLTFLKGDNPVVIGGSVTRESWHLLYPLTPTQCFIAGPAPEDEPGRIVPRQRKLADAETQAVNAAICGYAEASVIGVSAADRIGPRPTIKAHLSKNGVDQAVELPVWGLDTGEPSSSSSGLPPGGRRKGASRRLNP